MLGSIIITILVNSTRLWDRLLSYCIFQLPARTRNTLISILSSTCTPYGKCGHWTSFLVQSGKKTWIQRDSNPSNSKTRVPQILDNCDHWVIVYLHNTYFKSLYIKTYQNWAYNMCDTPCTLFMCGVHALTLSASLILIYVSFSLFPLSHSLSYFSKIFPLLAIT